MVLIDRTKFFSRIFFFIKPAEWLQNASTWNWIASYQKIPCDLIFFVGIEIEISKYKMKRKWTENTHNFTLKILLAIANKVDEYKWHLSWYHTIISRNVKFSLLFICFDYVFILNFLLILSVDLTHAHHM